MMIMTVDDSMTMRKIVGVVLKGAGHEIVEAENGEEALKKPVPLDMEAEFIPFKLDK